MPAVTYITDGQSNDAKSPVVDIIDIRGGHGEIDLKNEVIELLNPEKGPRKLPTLLLYDKRGLQLFEDITYLDEYYLTNKEIDVLKIHAKDMAAQVPAGSMLVELGSGNLRKICLLLQAFEDAGKQIDYYALDLSLDELKRTLAQVPEFKHVACHGLLGTYDDGKEWLKGVGRRPKIIISLGSSIGNFNRDDAAHFLEDFATTLSPEDKLLIGVDACSSSEKVYHAYNDAKGVTEEFTLNGLVHANAILGEEVFSLADWKAVGEYVYDDEGGRHQAFLVPIRDIDVLGVHLRANERIQIEQSLKYSPAGSERLWKLAGLEEVTSFDNGDEYALHLLQRAKMPFPLDPSIYAAGPLPTKDDWSALWAAWDTVTRRMLPEQELTEKPIKLRNACIFYLGHIPTFLDIQLTKRTDQPPTDPAIYYSIFERGIDPDVDNPEQCHDHSEIPDEWPPVEDIIAYQGRVRERVLKLYEQDPIPRSIGRAIWLGFEHEVMHLETLLYMMLQSPKTLPPPHTVKPDFVKMAREAAAARVPNEWFKVPEQEVTIGLDDPEDGKHPNLHYGWDNEKPARKENVHAFEAKGRPITNEEYAQYMFNAGLDQMPASWSTVITNGDSNGTTNGHSKYANDSTLPDSFLDGKTVRTVYGPVPLRLALEWPVMASYDELAGCAAWMGGRIPTFEEARSIYAYVDARKKILLQSKLAAKVPAVNGHLVNDGVEETPPNGVSQIDDSPALFVDLADANVGFRHWHPLPVTHRGDRLAGQGEMGGVWEWTSSPLQKHRGFEPMPMYPGYTADFFDEKHNVVLGGSWATHPRIAGRKSFVNWYQRKYPYAWVGARLVRSAQQ